MPDIGDSTHYCRSSSTAPGLRDSNAPSCRYIFTKTIGLQVHRPNGVELNDTSSAADAKSLRADVNGAKGFIHGGRAQHDVDAITELAEHGGKPVDGGAPKLAAQYVGQIGLRDAHARRRCGLSQIVGGHAASDLVHQLSLDAVPGREIQGGVIEDAARGDLGDAFAHRVHSLLRCA